MWRIAAVTGSFTILLVSGGIAPAATPGLGEALDRTVHAASQRYVMQVAMQRGGMPRSLRIRGRASAETISARLKVGDLKLPDGTKVPGPDGALLLDHAFLYERAPSNVVIFGNVHWFRLQVASPATSSALEVAHAITPAPLLRVLGEVPAWRSKPGSRLYRGGVAYDNPVVRASLERLTAGIEFRGLRVSAYVGRDGFIRRVLLVGRTADGKTSLKLSVRLFDFGRPVLVTPPKPGTFLDEELLRLPV